MIVHGSAKTVLALLVLTLCSLDDKLVAGQLDAVGAVLSVVPVTSILATAGLVGVKLAALSKLLQVLGYDQAYLASGGPGTAAEPIGLQTNYAYMFPYVPGLNISVSGENSAYQNDAAKQKYQTSSSSKTSASKSATRKTYPAMALPGDYENQKAPFRGSETLREIFSNVGLNLHIPTQQGNEQQQVHGQTQPPSPQTAPPAPVDISNHNFNQPPPPTHHNTENNQQHPPSSSASINNPPHVIVAPNHPNPNPNPNPNNNNNHHQQPPAVDPHSSSSSHPEPVHNNHNKPPQSTQDSRRRKGQ